MSFDAQRYRATQHQQWELAATGWSKWQSFYEEHCSDPKRLDTKVPMLILTSVLAAGPTNLPQIRQG